jgi:hypothetical protein
LAVLGFGLESPHCQAGTLPPEPSPQPKEEALLDLGRAGASPDL